MANDEGMQAIQLWKDGSQASKEGNFPKAASCYRLAISMAQGLPKDCSFDKPPFIAECQAGLAAALNNMGQYDDALACADQSLSFYDRFGSMYVLSSGPHAVALLNRAGALARLGRLDDALQAAERLKSMLADDPSNAQWMAMINNVIGHVNSLKNKKGKKWKLW